MVILRVLKEGGFGDESNDGAGSLLFGRVAAGGQHTCAIKADDSVQCWGMFAHAANDVPSALGSIKSISAGWWHTCAIKADDSVQCWGDDADGQSTVPVGLSNVKSISAGGYHTCVIKSDDSVQCWRSHTDGQSTVPAELSSSSGSGSSGSSGSSSSTTSTASATGTVEWARQLGTSLTDFSRGVASDSKGNIYVTGKTDGSLDGNANSGDYDLFVVEYNSAGVKQWTQQTGSSNYDYA